MRGRGSKESYVTSFIYDLYCKFFANGKVYCWYLYGAFVWEATPTTATTMDETPLLWKLLYPHWYNLGGGRLCCSYFIGKQNFEKSSRDFKISLPLPSAQFLMLLMKSNKIISCWFLLFIIWCALLLYVPYLWLLYFLIHLALIINFMLPRLFL